ncbi:MAG: hypothetical protein LWW95_08490 [Candidatus Desulfofervidus auxilii]|nr:hypothetical protein [Candidatus Desulfofervidus auxilii]
MAKKVTPFEDPTTDELGEIEKILESVEEKKAKKEKQAPLSAPSPAAKTLEAFTKRKVVKELESIKHLLGDSIKIKFKKVDEEYGKHTPIVVLSKSEIDQYSSLEEYVLQFLVPKEGRGLYIAEVIADDGSILKKIEIDTGREPKKEEEKKTKEEIKEKKEEKPPTEEVIQQSVNVVKLMNDVQQHLFQLQEQKADVIKKIYDEQINHLQKKIEELSEKPGNEHLIFMLQNQIENLKREMTNVDRSAEWVKVLTPLLSPVIQKLIEKKEPKENVFKETVDVMTKIMDIGHKQTEKFEKLIETLKEASAKKEEKSIVEKFIENVFSNPDKLEDIVNKFSGKDALEKQVEILSKQLDEIKSQPKTDPLDELVEQAKKFETLQKIFNPPNEKPPVEVKEETKDPIDQLLENVEKIEKLKAIFGGKSNLASIITIATDVLSKAFQHLSPSIQYIVDGWVKTKQIELERQIIEKTGMIPPSYLRQVQQYGELPQPEIQQPQPQETEVEKEKLDGLFKEYFDRTLIDIVAGLSGVITEKGITLEDLGGILIKEVSEELLKNENLLNSFKHGIENLDNLKDDMRKSIMKVLEINEQEAYALTEFILKELKEKVLG